MTNRELVNQRAGRKHELAREHLGLDWFDTESQARRIIEAIAEEEAGLKLAEAQIAKLREQIKQLEHQQDNKDSEIQFHMSRLLLRACNALSLDPETSSWFDVVGAIEDRGTFDV